MSQIQIFSGPANERTIFMATTQVLTSKGSATLDELVEFERQINEGLDRYFEDEYYVAVRIMHIIQRKAEGQEKPGLWRLVSPTFEDYCRSGRISMQKSYAHRLVHYAKARANLADLSPTGDSWCEWNVRPFTKGSLEPSDIRRISGKIRTYLKKNSDEQLSAKLVQRFIDKDAGKSSDEDNGLPPEEENLTPYLRQCIHGVRAMTRRLEQVPGESWDIVESRYPNLVNRLVKTLGELSSLLTGE
jgi:hypothetical protein